MIAAANASPPAGSPCVDVSAEADMRSHERLPDELRAMLRAAPFDVDAASVGLALDAERRRHPASETMAICATAAGLQRFLARVSAQHERGV